MELIRKSYLYPLVTCSYQYVSNVEITTYIERWHPEENTFHMSFDEMMITLDNISLLTWLACDREVCVLTRRNIGSYSYGPDYSLFGHQLL